MPVPENPPKLEVFSTATVDALDGSSFDSGGFKPAGSSTQNFLILEDGFEVTYGTSSEAGTNLTMPLTANAHNIVANGTYQGGGVWQDGNGVDWSLELGGSGSTAELRAVQV